MVLISLLTMRMVTDNLNVSPNTTTLFCFKATKIRKMYLLSPYNCVFFKFENVIQLSRCLVRTRRDKMGQFDLYVINLREIQKCLPLLGLFVFLGLFRIQLNPRLSLGFSWIRNRPRAHYKRCRNITAKICIQF